MAFPRSVTPRPRPGPATCPLVEGGEPRRAREGCPRRAGMGERASLAGAGRAEAITRVLIFSKGAWFASAAAKVIAGRLGLSPCGVSTANIFRADQAVRDG